MDARSGEMRGRAKPSKRAARPKPNGAAPAILDRAAILGADDLRRQRVPVPEWGGDVFVRVLPLADQGQFEDEAGREDRSSLDVMVRMVALCACDADGNALFTLDDAKALGGKAAEPLIRVARAAIEINAITASDIEGLAKN
jgi:hypothetical protein